MDLNSTASFGPPLHFMSGQRRMGFKIMFDVKAVLSDILKLNT